MPGLPGIRGAQGGGGVPQRGGELVGNPFEFTDRFPTRVLGSDQGDQQSGDAAYHGVHRAGERSQSGVGWDGHQDHQKGLQAHLHGQHWPGVKEAGEHHRQEHCEHSREYPGSEPQGEHVCQQYAEGAAHGDLHDFAQARLLGEAHGDQRGHSGEQRCVMAQHLLGDQIGADSCGSHLQSWKN